MTSVFFIKRETFVFYFYFVVIFLKCILSDNIEDTKVERYGGSLGGFMEWSEVRNILKIVCLVENRFLEKEYFPRFKEKISVNFVEIERCILLKANLSDVLIRINVDINKPMTLKLLNPEFYGRRYPEDLYFNGLLIQELQLYMIVYEDLFLTWNVTNPQNPLSSQFLIFRSLPAGVPKVTLYYSWIDEWNNCHDLKELNVYGMPARMIPKQWYFHCSNLETLRLNGVSEYQVHDRLTDGLSDALKNIKTLTMKGCSLHRLPIEILSKTGRLQHLDLSNNFLDDFSVSDWAMLYTPLSHLRTMNLARNNISTFGDLFHLRSLKSLTLDHNILMSNPVCVLSGRHCETIANENLEILSLSDNPEMELDSLFATAEVNWESYPKLRHLNVSVSGHALEETIEFNKLLRMKKLHIELNLSGRNFREVIFMKYEYEEMNETLFGTDFGINMTIPSKGLDCDCKHYWLARALTDYSDLLSVPNLRCSFGHEIIHEPLTNMDCVKVRDDDKMTVRKWDNYSSIHWHKKYDVDWKEIAQIASKLPIVQSLEVPDNNITSLDGAYLPPSLLTIDLRGNKISRLESSEAALLFSQPVRRVRLAGNLLICDCDNKPLLDALHRHHHQVEDFYNLTCIDSGEPLYTISSFEACLLRYTIIISGIIASLAITMTVLLWRYVYHIKVYMYHHGWCQSCLSEEDLDADKPYDVFLSYSHEDEDYVMQHLLPRLEGEPYYYKVCVHFRDWVIGDWIPAQIMRSVSESKRVIIVLSRSFAVSMWGKLEFRYALAGLTKNGRFKLLVLVLDDVLSMPLETEMQGYLALNTYMCCNDPMFWERLFYALPHRKCKLKGHTVTPEETDMEVFQEIPLY